MDAPSTSRALGAANDLIDLLRLAEGAAARLAQEVHGVSHEHAALITRELRRLRRSAEQLELEVENQVSHERSTLIA